MTHTVVGIFDTPDAAHAAEEALISHGLSESSMHLTTREGTEDGAGQPEPSIEDVRSYLEQLFGPEASEVVETIAEEVDHGGILLSVDVADDTEVDAIRETLVDAGAVDLDERMEQRHPSEASQTASSEEGQEQGQGKQTVPIVEEEMRVSKSETGQGKVRVVSRLEESPVEEEVTLKQEQATVERRPADREISPEEVEAQGERTIEIEETAEQPVVEKTARVVGEVEVGKETSERTEKVEDTVRHTEVDVEREPAKGSAGKGGTTKGGGGKA